MLEGIKFVTMGLMEVRVVVLYRRVHNPQYFTQFRKLDAFQNEITCIEINNQAFENDVKGVTLT